ncbi:MAG: hypothetical protein WC313_08965, partial [Candidatus Kapaibacterium sp.]
MDMKDYADDFYVSLESIYLNNKFDNKKKVRDILRKFKLFYSRLLSEEKRHFSTTLAGINFINDKYGLNEYLNLKLQGILKYQRQAQIKSSIVLSLDNLNFVVKYSSLIIQKISSIEIAPELQR